MRRFYANPYPCMPIVILALLMLASCSSARTHYYVLDSVAVEKAQTAQVRHTAVLQVEIAHYLDRPRIVSRDAENQLHISELHQWGGLLRENIARVVADDLSDRLGAGVVSAAPLPGSGNAELALIMDIRKFERHADGYIHLNVRWHVLLHGKIVQSGSEDMKSKQHSNGKNYAVIAAQMSTLLGQFSDSMANVIRSVDATVVRD